MEALLLLMLLVGAAAAAGLVIAELNWRKTRRTSWQTVRLRFGRDVTDDAVLGLLDRLGGLPSRAVVVLDVRADASGIAHYLSTDQATLDGLRGSLRALVPSIRLAPAGTADIPIYEWGRSLRLAGRLKVLRTVDPEPMAAGLLASLQPLGKGEAVLLRWAIRPGRPQAVQATRGKADEMPAEHRRLLSTKNDGTVLSVRGVLAATSGHPARAAHVLGRISAVLRSVNSAYGQLRIHPRSGPLLERMLETHWFFFTDRYAARELAPLLAWPIEAPVLPGLVLGTSPLLMPSPQVPSSGRVLGRATWPGSERPVAQPVLGALSHSLIAGPTGTGKSTLLTNLLMGDIAHGRGVVLIDGKGDTAHALLERIPEARAQDVIVLDCASDGPLPGLKLFGGSDPGLAADVVLGVLADLFQASWGPLSERYLRAGLIAVAHDPRGTLADVPFVFTDPSYRRRLVGRITDPVVKATFAAFEAMSAAERQQQLAAPLNKLGTLLGRPVVRTVLGQDKPQLDFRQVLAKRRIVVVSLAPARVGGPAARLIGALVVFGLFQAVQARSGLSERARTPFMVAIDEPRALGDLPMPLDALLEQARGLGVGVTLAPQSLTQLPKNVREAALTNVATRVVFRQNADDARLLARDLAGVSDQDLQDLGAYEAVARIGLGPGAVAPPVTIKTQKATSATVDGKRLAAHAAVTYGRTTAEVDAALNERHRPATGVPVGRKARAQT